MVLITVGLYGIPSSLYAVDQDYLLVGRSEWVLELEEVQRVPQGVRRFTDVVQLDAGKFFSRRLGFDGFRQAPLEVKKTLGGALHWEVMQTKATDAVALWTATVQGERLEGTLNLYAMSGPQQSLMYSFVGQRLTGESLQGIAQGSVFAQAHTADGPSWMDTVALLKERLLHLIILQDRMLAMERRQQAIEEQNRALAAAVLEQRAVEAIRTSHETNGQGAEAVVEQEAFAGEMSEHYAAVLQAEEAVVDLKAVEQQVESLYAVHEQLVRDFQALEQQVQAVRERQPNGPFAVLREQENAPEAEPLGIEQEQAMERIRTRFIAQLKARPALEEQLVHTQAVVTQRQDTIQTLQAQIRRLQYRLQSSAEPSATLKAMLKQKQAALEALTQAHARVVILLQRLRGIQEAVEGLEQKQLMHDE